ncbi:hypothetical protein Syun_006947 [Stephania yunnanensis]|uniref:Uncharacterized protein n=1 Tax=Stephania yunnanensis TaxID=152371 RepID=A0AAP0KXU8_9MAGN
MTETGATRRRDQRDGETRDSRETRADQVNMAGLEIDVLLKKTMTNEVIDRYEKIDRYTDFEYEKEKAEIASRETEQRRKIRTDKRRVLEEKQGARNNLNVEQPTMDYNGLYMEESEFTFMGTILRNRLRTPRNHELVFENQMALAISIHMMERSMSRRHIR